MNTITVSDDELRILLSAVRAARFSLWVTDAERLSRPTCATPSTRSRSMPKTATRQPATKQMFQLLADEDGEHREGLYYCGYCVEMDMARSNVADNDYTDIYGAEYQIVRRSLSTRCGGEDCES